MASEATIPHLDGVHHLKLPVSDLDRSTAWYERTLGYQRSMEFVEQGVLMGVGMHHPNGGPRLTLRLHPELARAASGFDYFSIGVPTREEITELATLLDARGESHAGVHRASIGWILPGLHDPDGHEVRFYSDEHHTDLPPGQVARIVDPRETAERLEAEEQAGRA